MHPAGVSLTVSASLSSPPLFPALVVKNSLDTVCIASARMSPLMASCVGKGSFRGPEGLDGAPSECRGALRSFDVCVRSRAQRWNEMCKSLGARPRTVGPVGLAALAAKVHSSNVCFQIAFMLQEV